MSSIRGLSNNCIKCNGDKIWKSIYGGIAGLVIPVRYDGEVEVKVQKRVTTTMLVGGSGVDNRTAE